MERVDGVGEASIFKGDPRRAGARSDMDGWLTGILERGSSKGISARPYLYGSDAGFCARRNVLLQNNTWLESTVNSAGRGYMAIGVAFEELLVQALQRQGRFLAGQLRGVELGGLKISSKFDAIILDADDNLALLEVKTCGQIPGKEKPAHLAQIQMYAAISGIRNAYLVYMSRNLTPKRPIPLKTFQVNTEPEALLNRLQIANESLLASTIPALPPKPAAFRKHTECHYCEFRDDFCWGDRPGRSGAAPNPPLAELTPEAYIRLAARARQRAEEHLSSIDYRLLETVRELQKESLTPHQQGALSKLESELRTKLAG